LISIAVRPARAPREQDAAPLACCRLCNPGERRCRPIGPTEPGGWI